MNSKIKQLIRSELKESARIKVVMSKTMTDKIAESARLIIKSLKNGGKILLVGNGGSAADAQHIAADFVGRFRLERPPFRAIALTTNTSILSAIANDYGYSYIFTRQFEALAEKSDVLIAISTSGLSDNIIQVAKMAKDKKVKVVALTGLDGGKLKELCDVGILVPSLVTSHIQEAHVTIEHIICLLVENYFSKNEK